jgi:hypothetical protein
MTHLVDQLPKLQLIWYYNFGEPFLHPDSIAFLRHVKQTKPCVQVHTSTNGIPLTRKKATALVEERLVRNIVFSIDGSSQPAYERYRRSGSFDKAFGNMVHMQREITRCSAEKDVRLFWQYILFQWNDGDADIQRARELAEENDLEIKWVLTHTPGASQKYTYGSEAFSQLVSNSNAYDNLTCELQAMDLEVNKVKNGCYQCELSAPVFRIHEEALEMHLVVINTSARKWYPFSESGFRLGVRILDAEGEEMIELDGLELVAELEQGEMVIYEYNVSYSLPSGSRYVFIDMVHDQVCWFHEKGSTPLVLPVGSASR